MAEFRFFSVGPRDPDNNLQGDFHGTPVHALHLKGPRLGEAVAWCEDVDRPGQFSYQQVGAMGVFFWFTDKNVAFEFRMAWG